MNEVEVLTKMKVVELLTHIRELNGSIQWDGDKLRVRAPEGTLSPEWMKELSERKEEIIAFLKKGKMSASLPAIVPELESRYEPFGLTDVQQAYWLGRSGDFELGNVATHIYMEFEEEGMDPKRLEQAWRILIERHDMLRAIVHPDGRQQVLESVPPYSLKVTDLRGMPQSEAGQELLHIRETLSHQVLQSNQWPLFDIRASLMGEQLVRLHVSMDLLIADAMSCQILLRELAMIYQDLSTPLAPVELTFRDCVLAMKAIEDTELYQESLAYWQKRLPSLPPAPELPLAVKPDEILKPRFIRRKGFMRKESWSKLKKRAKAAGVTPTIVLLSAFSEILRTWSRNPQFTLNLTLFNRTPLHPQMNEVVGDYTTLNLLEINAGGERSFEQKAREMQEQLWADLDHRHVGGVRVMREYAKMYGGAQRFVMPIIFTSELDNADEELFIIQNEAETGNITDNIEVAGLGKEVYGISQTPQVWLDHQVGERSGALTFNWDAAEDLFPAGVLDTMFETYCLLLQQLADEETCWSHLGRIHVPADLAATGLKPEVTRVADQELLPAVFAKHCEQRPDHPALVYGGHQMTYSELDVLTNRMGRWLREQGVKPNQLVAIVMEKGWEQIAAVLGILKSGAAYLPVAADLPQERISYLLDNGQVSIVFSQSVWKDKLACPVNTQVVYVDEYNWPDLDGGALEEVLQPDDLAYVIYTSGSTGAPKGVAVDHRGIVNTIREMNGLFGIGDNDRILALSALNFDLSVYDIFGTFAAGATLVLPRADSNREPAHWAELLSKERITVWNSVPALMEMLVEYLTGHSRSLPDYLRWVWLSGDRIPLELPGQVKTLAPQAGIVSLGGATEASIWSIMYPIEQVDPSWNSIPYGKALPNQNVYVMDEELNIRPVWVPGDIIIGGAGVARGYWRDEEKTSSSFVIHPVTGERLYRTGDVGRYRPDGNIEFLGREDLQVKIGGYRIELGEIENALAQYPDVHTSAVHIFGEAGETKRLVAFLVSETKSEFSYDHVRSYLSTKLPAYMIPQAFVTLDELPLTANGKINRQALPLPEQGPANKGYVAPVRPIERELAAILANELGIVQAGIYDNFFELGGDSILAIRLLHQVKNRYNVEIPVRRLFEAPTIWALVNEIELLGNASGTHPAVEEVHVIQPNKEDLHKPFPLTGLQQAYLIGRSDAIALGNVACHTYEEVDFGYLDLERFSGAWSRLINRHDMLRTVIRRDGQQEVLKDLPSYTIEVADLRGKTPEACELELMALRERMSHQVMDIEQWPLFEIRATILEQGTRLHLSVDAMIADAWSVGILTKEVCELYEHPERELEELSITFRDYVMGEIALKETEPYKKSLEYWLPRLLELPPAPGLPQAKTIEAIEQPQFVRRRSELSPENWNKLKKNAAQIGLTPSGIMMAAFSEVLTIWSDSPKFTINVPQFNRMPLHPEVNALVGEFASFYLLEVDNTEEDTFVDRAKRLQGQLWQDMNHSYVSGVQIIRELAKAQGGGQAVAIPIVFTSTIGLLEEDTSPFDGLGQVVYSISQTPQVWLDCQVGEKGDGVMFNWDAVDEIFPSGMLDDMFMAYCDLLLKLANYEAVWSSRQLDLVPRDQLEQREAVNQTGQCMPDTLVHMLFAEQADRSPDQIAVISHDRIMTYGDVFRESNQAARLLRECGAEPNKLVAIVMEKGWEQVVGAMAVIQSGAACLPIDAELPLERIQYAMENGEVDVVLTQSRLDEALHWPEGITRISLDTVDLSNWEDIALSPVQKPEDLAYVIYTSGSTGTPKGVMISHRSLANVVLYTNEALSVSASDRMLALTMLHHDLAMYDLFGMLAAGGVIVLPDPSLRREPSHWLELMRAEHVTLWNSVPAMLEMLLAYAEDRNQSLPESLRQAIAGGDRIPVTLPERLKALSGHARFLSIGGPTETTIWNIWYPVDEVKPDWTTIPYGKPIANNTYYIMDSKLNDKPTWVAGEMYCEGVQLAKGYWGDLERTRSQFVYHPRTGRRLYRTGDIGRYLPDGNIEFVGRADNQIKVNGNRIELGEIESVLVKHDDVRAAAVTFIEQGKNKRIVAYYVPERSANSGEANEETADPLHPDALEAEGILLDPIARLEFKQKHLGIRSLEHSQSIQLPLSQNKDESAEPYINRRSYRIFKETVLSMDQFGGFLRCLVKMDFEKLPFPKYRFGSAGGLYPVQVYLYIKEGRVEGIAGGAYYYNPYENRLVSLPGDVRLEGKLFPPGNREVFEASAFSLCLIGEMDAIQPMYGSMAKNFCYLEAGLMTQLLEMTAPDYEVGLCQIGNVNEEIIREIFQLGDSHVYLHSLFGGSIDTTRDKLAGLEEDWGGYKISVEKKEEASALNQELTAYLKEKLPAHMIPVEYVPLAALPLTSNGKVNRKLLPLPGFGDKLEETVFVKPRNAEERKLALILATGLGHDEIGVHDNFFELGADSLMAIQFISHIQQSFQVDMPLRSLFAEPTIAGLANKITELGGQLVEEGDSELAEQQGGQSDLPVIIHEFESRYEPFPLTDVQQACWIGRNFDLELGNIGMHVYLEVEQADLDLERFGAAWRKLVERHEMLRAIVLPDGQQQILKGVPEYTIAVLDLQDCSKETVDLELHAIRERMSHQVLPSDRWPLFEMRASLLRDHKVRMHVSIDLLICDVWSSRIVSQELIQLYLNPDLELEPLEVSFRDYVLAEMKIRGTQIYETSMNYWKNRIPTLPPAPELPIIKQPGSLARPEFVRRVGSLEPVRWERLKARATQAGLTHSGMLAAAYAEVLTAWSKNPHFTLNLSLFNRLPIHPQINQIVGDFTSIILLEIDNSGLGGFTQRARQLQQQLWDDLDHRFVSGVQVIREMARQEGSAPRAVMPVVFTSTLNLGPSDYPSGSLDSEDDTIYGISQTPQVWLDHVVSEQGGALVFNWDAVEELFPEGLLDSMFAAYCHLLNTLADTEEAWHQTVHELVPVPACDLQLYREVNNTTAPESRQLLHELFLNQAEQRPDQVAVIAPGQTLTYGDLTAYALRIGGWLRDRGAKANSLVAIIMDKGWEQIAAALGVLHSGAAYLPINPDLPESQLLYMLDNGEVELVLTQSWVADRIGWPDTITSLNVDQVMSLGLPVSLAADIARSPEDLAYVIYTSGSTGTPKGVMIDHRGAVNTILDINRRFGVGEEDRVLALSSFSFDLSVYDVFGLLAAGGAIIIPESDGAKDPAHWVDLITEQRVTIWNTVPTLMEMLVEYAGGRQNSLPNALRLVLLSGDWIPVSLPERIHSIAEGVQIISLGGATEAAIWSIAHPIEQVEPEASSIPYGKPLCNQTFHVLDVSQEPRPLWVPGNLYIGGLGLARGYWRDDEKSASSFIQCPRTGERLYYTGDIGRYTADGSIEFLGREDLQVKIQGHRIELGEIEAALCQHPAVRSAIVTAVGENRQKHQMVAYVVADRQADANPFLLNVSASAEGSDLSVKEVLHKFLSDKVAYYMLPSEYILLDDLPLNANGKVDRKALPAPDRLRQGTEYEYIAPTTAVEEELAHIWAEVLGLAQIGIRDNFFELGGHSLLAAQVMTRTYEVFKVEIPMRMFFEAPFIEGFARNVEALLWMQQSASESSGENSGVREEIEI